MTTINNRQNNKYYFSFFPNKIKSKGFTLIELLVVIAIIGLLSSVVLASLSEAREKARWAVFDQEIKQIILALNLYYDKNGSWPIIPHSTGGADRLDNVLVRLYNFGLYNKTSLRTPDNASLMFNVGYLSGYTASAGVTYYCAKDANNGLTPWKTTWILYIDPSSYNPHIKSVLFTKKLYTSNGGFWTSSFKYACMNID